MTPDQTGRGPRHCTDVHLPLTVGKTGDTSACVLEHPGAVTLCALGDASAQTGVTDPGPELTAQRDSIIRTTILTL